MRNLPSHIGMRMEDTLIHPITEHPVVECNIFDFGKGGLLSMQHEIEGSIFGAMPLELEDGEFINETIEDFFDYYKNKRIKYEPLTWQQVVMEKADDTSMGLPLGAKFADHGCFKEAYDGDFDLLYEDLQQAEDDILEGCAPISVWKCLPKEDKYSRKKIEARRFRLVSIGSYVLLCICRRWLSQVDSYIKDLIQQFHVLGTNEMYEKHVLSRLISRYSLGVDYTAFDKNSGRTFVTTSIQFLDFMSNYQTPRKIIEYIILNISNPVTILPSKDGEHLVYNLSGTNPSGQLFTTSVNSVTHLLHNCVILRRVYRISVRDYLADLSMLRSAMTGDDGLETCETKEQTMLVVSMLARKVAEYFGIPAKVEGLTNHKTGALEPYPLDVMAPYLSEVCVLRYQEGYYYRFPCNPKRMLARLIFVPEDKMSKMSELMPSRCQNIAHELHSLTVHETLNVDIPQNTTLKRMHDYIRQNRVILKSPQDVGDRVFMIPKGQITIS